MTKEQVREKMADIVFRCSKYAYKETLKYVDQILAIDGLEIKSDDQSLPTIRRAGGALSISGQRVAQQDMLNAGFIKCERRE
jgi:hypothetical protein